MSEALKYVSPEYQKRLDDLAELLVTGRRFGQVALQDTIEFDPVELQLLLFEADQTQVL